MNRIDLIPRNQPDPEDDVRLGLQWERQAEITILPRRMPWTSVTSDIASEWAKSQSRSGAGDAVTVTTTTVPAAHTHPPSDIQSTGASTGAVLAIGASGPAWTEPAAFAGVYDIRWNSPKLEVKRAAGGEWETVFTAIPRCQT